MVRETIESRCFPNPLAEAEGTPGHASSPSQTILRGGEEVPRLEREVRQTLMEALHFYSAPIVPGSNTEEEWCGTECCGNRQGGGPSVYIGRAGIDWALMQLRIQRIGGPLQENLKITQWYITEKDNELPQNPRSASDCSLLTGPAGVWFVLSMRTLMLPTLSASPEAEVPAGKETAETVNTFLRFCDYGAQNADADEWLYGRCGLLLGLLMLLQQLQLRQHDVQVQRLAVTAEELIVRMTDTIFTSGVRTAAAANDSEGPPIRYFWHGKEFVGAGHGYFGILYILLLVPHIRKDLAHPLHHQIKLTLNWLLQFETEHHNYPAVIDPEHPRGDHLVHFCHGAPGAVFTFGEAYKVYKDEVYRQAAERAATCVWRFGILRKGPGLCHGVAGNGYALLRWYQLTKQPVWLERAVRFAIETNTERQKKIRNDHPFSLFEGSAGVCCFLSDLIHDPLNARMPFFGI